MNDISFGMGLYQETDDGYDNITYNMEGVVFGARMAVRSLGRTTSIEGGALGSSASVLPSGKSRPAAPSDSVFSKQTATPSVRAAAESAAWRSPVGSALTRRQSEGVHAGGSVPEHISSILNKLLAVQAPVVPAAAPALSHRAPSPEIASCSPSLSSREPSPVGDAPGDSVGDGLDGDFNDYGYGGVQDDNEVDEGDAHLRNRAHPVPGIEVDDVDMDAFTAAGRPSTQYRHRHTINKPACGGGGAVPPAPSQPAGAFRGARAPTTAARVWQRPRLPPGSSRLSAAGVRMPVTVRAAESCSRVPTSQPSSSFSPSQPSSSSSVVRSPSVDDAPTRPVAASAAAAAAATDLSGTPSAPARSPGGRTHFRNIILERSLQNFMSSGTSEPASLDHTQAKPVSQMLSSLVTQQQQQQYMQQQFAGPRRRTRGGAIAGSPSRFTHRIPMAEGGVRPISEQLKDLSSSASPGFPLSRPPARTMTTTAALLASQPAAAAAAAAPPVFNATAAASVAAAVSEAVGDWTSSDSDESDEGMDGAVRSVSLGLMDVERLSVPSTPSSSQVSNALMPPPQRRQLTEAIDTFDGEDDDDGYTNERGAGGGGIEASVADAQPASAAVAFPSTPTPGTSVPPPSSGASNAVPASGGDMPWLAAVRRGLLATPIASVLSPAGGPPTPHGGAAATAAAVPVSALMPHFEDLPATDGRAAGAAIGDTTSPDRVARRGSRHRSGGGQHGPAAALLSKISREQTSDLSCLRHFMSKGSPVTGTGDPRMRAGALALCVDTIVDTPSHVLALCVVQCIQGAPSSDAAAVASSGPRAADGAAVAPLPPATILSHTHAPVCAGQRVAAMFLKECWFGLGTVSAGDLLTVLPPWYWVAPFGPGGMPLLSCTSLSYKAMASPTTST